MSYREETKDGQPRIVHEWRLWPAGLRLPPLNNDTFQRFLGLWLSVCLVVFSVGLGWWFLRAVGMIR